MFDNIKPHLAELRKRLSISVLSVVIMFAIAFAFNNPILTWVTTPLSEALAQVGKIVDKKNITSWNVKTDKNSTISSVNQLIVRNSKQLQDTLGRASRTVTGELRSLLKESAESAKRLSALLEKKFAHNGMSTFDGKITTNQVGGAFFVALKVSIFAALLMALPIILWQLWLFIAPGLYDNEKKLVVPFVFGGTFAFLIGVLFAYYVVTPFGFQSLIQFGSFLYTPLINIEDYVGFFTKILMGFGLAFELPVITSFMGMLGMINDRTLMSFFKYAVVLIFVLAALLTPPDIFTQVLMAIPLIMLYGLSIALLKIINPYTPDEEEQ